MRNNIFPPILLLLFILILFLFSLPAGATGVNAPTTTEIIDEVARFTGLSKDLTQLVLESEPELLARFGETVFGAQVLNLLLEAKDTEVMRSIFNYEVAKLADKLMNLTIHPAVGTFFTAVKAYKSSLEVVRDYIIIPKLDHDTYARYKKARGGVLSYSYANPTEAFEEATFAPFGGYYLLKEEKYKELIEAKGYNPEYLGNKLESFLRRNIDDFWMKQMEAKYVQEKMQESQEAMVNSIWKSAQSEIDLLKKLASELGTIHEGLFVELLRDLPEEWWFVEHREGVLNGQPKEGEYAWIQKFQVSDAKEDYQQDADGYYFRMIDQRKTYDLPYTNVMISISPRFEEIEGEVLDGGKYGIQYNIDNEGYQPVGNLGVACLLQTESEVRMNFYRGMYYCYVCISGITPGVMQKHVDLAYHFSRIVAGKMPTIVIEKAE